MRFIDDGKLGGRLTIKVYRIIDEVKILINTFEDYNLITISGLQLLTFLLIGAPGNNKITKIGAGEDDTPTHRTDTGLSNAFIKTIDSYSFLNDNVVQFNFSFDSGDATGMIIKEFGLFSQDEQLFSRKLQIPAIPKDADIIIEGEWTISVFECKVNEFAISSLITIKLNSDLDAYIRRFSVNPNIQTDINNPILNSNKNFNMNAVIQNSIISDANTEREFASSDDIVSNISSDMGIETGFFVSADVDDGHVCQSGGCSFDYTNNEIQMGFPTATFKMRNWARWDNVVIPSGANIIQSFIRFRASRNKSNNTVRIRFTFEYSDDAPTPISSGDLFSRVDTESLGIAGYVDQNDFPPWISDLYYDSPDITSPLQLVMDRPGWNSGNAIMAIIKDNGSSQFATRWFDSVNGSQNWTAAELVIRYTL